MLHSKRALVAFSVLFSAVEAVLGLLLQITPVAASRHLSFAAVVLACLACPLLASRTRSYLFTQVALVFTVVADSILVYHRMEHAVLAMCAFSVTQLAYGARLYVTVGRRAWQLALRLALSALALLLVRLVAGGTADALAYIALFYFANLLSNTLIACLGGRRQAVLATGLVLFVLCDVFVGFSMLGEYLPPPDTALIHFLSSPPINMAWVFYLPCTVLLVLSLLPERWRRAGSK